MDKVELRGNSSKYCVTFTCVSVSDAIKRVGVFMAEDYTGYSLQEHLYLILGNNRETMNYPKITVVTPSYNQGQFIEETILSVIGQGYPNLEYIVMDGGSTDDTRRLLKKYESKLSYWVSEKDKGQSDAINRGFLRATGDIYGWLNSDDMYLPGTLLYVARTLNVDRPEMIFGNCFHFIDNTSTAWGSDVEALSEKHDLSLCDYVIQPGAFWARSAWDITGPLNNDLHYTLDWDWFIRAKKAGVNMVPVSRYMALFRFHEGHKTSSGPDVRSSEIGRLYNEYVGAKYLNAYMSLCSNLSRIGWIENWIVRLKLQRFSGVILRSLYPEIYREIEAKELQSIKLMLPLPQIAG